MEDGSGNPLPNRLVIQADGSARNNPGPAGIGIAVLDESGAVVKKMSRPIGDRTNNQAEYEAVLAALLEALERPRSAIVVQTDSSLIYHQLIGRFKVKNSGLAALCDRCRELLARLPNVTLRLVPREENRIADKLAQAASAGKTQE